MDNLFERKAGICLIIFAVLLLITAMHHPGGGGGGIPYLIHVSGLIVVVHAIAIFSLPFGWVGFWGLTKKIGTDRFWSILAFSMMSVGLMAVLFAATINGLVLPIFLQHYKEASPETLTTIDPILRYGLAINHAFDYIYTGAFCVAVLCWSIAIVTTGALARWIGWFGIGLALITAAIFLSGMPVITVYGLRVFASGMILWIGATGILLLRGLPKSRG